ncbi:MAG: hypothetical protein ABI977_18455, partial [Acidobacteriota bacterium]
EEERRADLSVNSLRCLSVLCASAVNSTLHFEHYQKINSYNPVAASAKGRTDASFQWHLYLHLFIGMGMGIMATGCRKI